VISCPTPSLRGVPKGQEWQLLEVKFIPEGGRRERDQVNTGSMVYQVQAV